MSKYGYKEIRTLQASALRNLCIDKNWYTNGNNEEYTFLLNMCNNENITTDNIVEMATDIISHSIDIIDCDLTTTYYHVCFEIARICNTIFEEI